MTVKLSLLLRRVIRSRPGHAPAPADRRDADAAPEGDGVPPPAREPRWRFPIAWKAMVLVGLPIALSGLCGYLVIGELTRLSTRELGLVALHTVAMSGVAIALCLAWARHLTHRIERIAQRLADVQAGDYQQRPEERARDELGELARRASRLAIEVARRERRIGENALHDPLTGLPNRTLLTDRIRREIRQGERAHTTFAVLVIDLDRFKFVNDTLGHAAGDQVLKEVARRLRATVRDTDTVARLGGDEFVVLVPGDPTMAEEVARRVVASLREPWRKGEQLIDIGASIGIAVYPQHGEKETTLLRRADSAMYRAKRRQTGFEVFDGEESGGQRSYLSMLSEMRRALDQGQFELHYQPKLDLSSGLIVGAEGLLRWKHPTRGQVPPGEFVPFAEQTGFMRVITRWVVAEGLRFADTLAQAGLDLRVSVNVTAGDIQNPVFASEVAELAQRHPSAAQRLCLEITESGVVSESQTALDTLHQIARLGVKLSVDDFGTGYSTLKQLQQLPVQELKIDRSFVIGIIDNHGSQTIVRSTIDLARQMGLRVVAEGVENFRQMRALARIGCQEIQGYYLAKPMPGEELRSWVEMRHALHANSRETYFDMLTAER